MLRVRFISALVISIVLVGGAMWFRFVKIPPYTNPVATVTQVEQVESTSTDDLLLTDFFNTETSIPATSTTALSQTDLIGRQLFSDYLALKSEGKTTPDDINAFAASLAESIKNHNLSIT